MEPFDVLNMVIFSFGAAFQAKYQKIHTFLTISQDSVHIFKNQFLRWNRGFKPVVLSTITPMLQMKMWPMFKTSNCSIFSLPVISFHEKCIFNKIWHALAFQKAKNMKGKDTAKKI